MDADRFDQLVVTLTHTRTRRSILAILGAVSITGLAARDVAGACRVVGQRCRRPGHCCTSICTRGTCRCPDGRKACRGLCCNSTQGCRDGRCCTVTGAICPANPTDCCSAMAGTGGCSGAHDHCCVFKGACTTTTECCFSNQRCKGGVCCFVAGTICGSTQRCCSGVCDSTGHCT